jgi:signal transduction histidine kinase
LTPGCVHYFVELFVKSRHRSSLSVVLLIVGVFGSAVPLVLSEAGLTAVEGFDHAPLGIPLFVVPASYAVFRLGMMDVPPVARDNLLDELRDPVLVLDAERTLLDYNAASEALAEPLAASDPVGRDAATLLPDVFGAIGLPEDPDATATESVTMADGTTHRHYSVLVSPVAEEGTVVAYAVMLRDVTELESTRRELERTNERLDRFASVVSHDLRNPINVAEGYADSLASDIERADVRGDPTAADMLDTLDEVETSHERMRTIISDLRTLAHSRDRVEDPDPHRFGDVARDAWDTVDTADASLVVETDGRIYADRGRLRSVFENLFRNSAEHGSVSSRSEADDAADAEGLTVRVGLTEAGFYVADDGPGIPEDSRDDVFEYGYTTSSAGTGLGLSIVRSMAESHGWDVSLTDSGADGARFEFEDVVVRSDDGALAGQASVGE